MYVHSSVSRIERAIGGPKHKRDGFGCNSYTNGSVGDVCEYLRREKRKPLGGMIVRSTMYVFGGLCLFACISYVRRLSFRAAVVATPRSAMFSATMEKYVH